MTVPALTTEQLRAARQAATAARRRRAELKERLRTGDLSLPEALGLAAEDDILAHAKVVDVLKSVPRVGEKRAKETMARLDIAPNRRLRGLGKHQVAALKEEFGRRTTRAGRSYPVEGAAVGSGSDDLAPDTESRVPDHDTLAREHERA